MKQSLLVVLVVLALALSVGCRGKRKASVTDPPPTVNTKLVDRHLRKADRYLERGLDDSALAAFALAIEENPDLIEAHMGMGGIYIKREDFRKAERSFTSAAKIDRNSFEAHYQLGLTRQLMGKISQAIQTYLRAIELNPEDFNVNLNLASAYLMVGEAQTALPYLEKAVELDDESEGAWANLAAAYSLLGRWEDALGAYRDALELGEVPEPVVLGLADAHLRLGNYRLAINTLNAYVRRSPSAIGYERLGYAQFKLKLFDTARESYKAALEIDPKHTNALNGFGVCMMAQYVMSGGKEKGFKDKAIKAWRQSIKIRPQQPRIIDLLSRYEKIYDPTKEREKKWNDPLKGDS